MTTLGRNVLFLNNHKIIVVKTFIVIHIHLVFKYILSEISND